MALIHCDFYSEVLGISASMYVILPQSTRSQIGIENKTTKGRHPTLYLLHGLTDDHTNWMRSTSIERYAAPLGLAVVMPAVNRSYYADMKYGYRYWKFVSEELPAIARTFFPLSDLRADNFVAGNSMGGFGAFKLALNHPDKFCAAASLSGVVDMQAQLLQSQRGEFDMIYENKDSIVNTIDDLFFLSKKVASSDGPKPALYQCCGTKDFLYKQNVDFKEFCNKLPLSLTSEEDEGGDHDWSYWDIKIQRVLSWLPLNTAKDSWIAL